MSVIKSHQSSPYAAKYQSPAPDPYPSPAYIPPPPPAAGLLPFQGFIAEGGGFAAEEGADSNSSQMFGGPPILQLYHQQPTPAAYSDSA